MSAASAPPSSLTLRILRRVVDVRADELGVLFGSAATFFCVLGSFFLLRPLREEIGLSRGAQNLPWLWTGTLGVTLLFAPLFAWLVSKYPPSTFLPLTYRFLAANLVVFAVLARVLHGEPLTWLNFAFYFWFSAANMLVASVFWALMADVFRQEQSRRLFGFISVGGTLGALGGAWLVKLAVHDIGALGLMAISIVLLEIAARCVRALARRLGAREVERAPAPRVVASPARTRNDAWEGLRIVARDPYMRAVGLYILFQTLGAAFLNLQLNYLIEDARQAGPDRVAAFADRDFWTQLATLAIQLFVTGRVLTWFGVSFALALQPFVAAAGFTLLAFVLPTDTAGGTTFPAELATLDFALWTTVLVNAAFSAAQHGISRPARESLFTVVDTDTKYKAKSFLDTFVLRGGDSLFAWVARALRENAGFAPAMLATCAVPCALAWLVTGAVLGRKQAARARRDEPTLTSRAEAADAPV